MATVKVKFRPSTVDGRQGSIFYQVIHKRIVRQQKTDYHLYSHEWNNNLSKIIFPKSSHERRHYLLETSNKIRMDMNHFKKIIADLDFNSCCYTANDVILKITSNLPYNSLFSFMEDTISNLKTIGRIRTSETYTTTLSSFKRFRKNRDLTFDDIDSDMMTAYQAYLYSNGVSANSSSFYMRNLRAMYNRAVEKGLTAQKLPFKHVYTGVDKTIKRGIPIGIVKKLKEINFSLSSPYGFARDMFLFSFYTRGMSFVDMAYLRKKDLQKGVLSYRRRKTGQQLIIKWEECMQEIVDKYDTSHSHYLLPIINPNGNKDERKQYIYSAHSINRCLKVIGEELDLSVCLTFYVARHSWASIAKSMNIPLSVISEGMGHDSEATTRIYLASLDNVEIDNANKKILQSLHL
ncbi:MAG: site-specific integrase [Bacteroidales bacterium]|nr:site-specific integrase [Bacteroidales bacterium]